MHKNSARRLWHARQTGVQQALLFLSGCGQVHAWRMGNRERENGKILGWKH